jgi:hypothetical protein
MQYAFVMESGAMIYIPGFIKIGSDIQKLLWGCIQRHRKPGDLISLLLFYFFQNKESRVKTYSSFLNMQLSALIL